MRRLVFDKKAGHPGAFPSSSTVSPVTVHTPVVRQWIEQIAYEIWAMRGRQPGDDLWNWLSAEKFVLDQLMTAEPEESSVRDPRRMIDSLERWAAEGGTRRREVSDLLMHPAWTKKVESENWFRRHFRMQAERRMEGARYDLGGEA